MEPLHFLLTIFSAELHFILHVEPRPTPVLSNDALTNWYSSNRERKTMAGSSSPALHLKSLFGKCSAISLVFDFNYRETVFPFTSLQIFSIPTGHSEAA